MHFIIVLCRLSETVSLCLIAGIFTAVVKFLYWRHASNNNSWSYVSTVPSNHDETHCTVVVLLNLTSEGRLINKLQNVVILLIFKI